jgi:hypothetical protein
VDPQAEPGTVPEIRLKSEGADSKAFSSMHYAMRNPVSPYPDEEQQIHQERVQGRGFFYVLVTGDMLVIVTSSRGTKGILKIPAGA